MTAPGFYAPAATGLAAGAGATLLGRPIGLGITLTALGLFAAAMAAFPPRDRWRRAWWAIAFALALMPTLRAAGWVQAISLLGAVLFAALGAGGFTGFRDAAATAGRAAIGVLPGPLLVVGALLERAGGRWGRSIPALRGVVLAVVLVVPFAALFATADAAFAQWLDEIAAAVPDLEELPARLGIAALVLGVAGALLLVTAARARPDRPAGAPLVGRTEWAIALGALNALFAAFVALQLTTLFGGHAHVLRTTGLTYAEYAREGFGQLVVVAILTLAVIAAARRWTAREDAREERLQRLLLGGLCVLTLVVLVSAHRRLGLYVEAFGATRERLFAQWEILWLGALLLAVLVAGAVPRAPWLARAAVAITGAALVTFGLSDPDRRVAERNVERFAQTGKLDTWELMTLSADAVPAIRRLPERLSRCILVTSRSRDGLAGLNLARRRADGQVPGYDDCALSS